MATIQMPTKDVLRYAKDMIMGIDREIAEDVNHEVDRRMSMRRGFFTKRPLYSSVARAMADDPFLKFRLIFARYEEQRKRLTKICVLCERALARHLGAVTLDHDDVWALGRNSMEDIYRSFQVEC